MIQQQTILKIADNSGAKNVKCIKVLGGSKKKIAFLGNIIIVSVQKLRNKSKISSKIKKGDVLKAFIIRVKKKIKKKDGSIYFFKNNFATLINKKNNPIANRIFGPISKSFKINKLLKFTKLSSGFI